MIFSINTASEFALRFYHKRVHSKHYPKNKKLIYVFRHLEETELPHQTKCYFFVSIYEKLQLSVYFGTKALSQSTPDNDESQKTASRIHVARTELIGIIKKFDDFKDMKEKYIKIEPTRSFFRYPEPPP